MKKVVGLSVLGLAAWFGLTFAWAVTARVIGLPGPAEAATKSLEVTTRLLAAPALPGPLAVPKRLALRQLRLSRRLVVRACRLPERLAARWLDRDSFAHAAAPDAEPGGPSPDVPFREVPAAPDVPAALEATAPDAEAIRRALTEALEARIRFEVGRPAMRRALRRSLARERRRVRIVIR